MNTGMNEESSRLVNRDLLTAEPSDQLIGIRCLKNRCDGIPAMNIPVPCCHCEQMEVMVTEKALRPSGFLKLLHPSQRFKRLRAAVDEISHEDQGSGIGKLFQQAFQAFIAALQITDSNDRRSVQTSHSVFPQELMPARLPDTFKKRSGGALILKTDGKRFSAPGADKFRFGQILNPIVAAFDIDIRAHGFNCLQRHFVCEDRDERHAFQRGKDSGPVLFGVDRAVIPLSKHPDRGVRIHSDDKAFPQSGRLREKRDVSAMKNVEDAVRHDDRMRKL